MVRETLNKMEKVLREEEELFRGLLVERRPEDGEKEDPFASPEGLEEALLSLREESEKLLQELSQLAAGKGREELLEEVEFLRRLFWKKKANISLCLARLKTVGDELKKVQAEQRACAGYNPGKLEESLFVDRKI